MLRNLPKATQLAGADLNPSRSGFRLNPAPLKCCQPQGFLEVDVFTPTPSSDVLWFKNVILRFSDPVLGNLEMLQSSAPKRPHYLEFGGLWSIQAL